MNNTPAKHRDIFRDTLIAKVWRRRGSNPRPTGWETKTKRERLKSALYLKSSKSAKHFFLEKKLEIFFNVFFFRKMSHSAEKCKRGTLLDLLTYILLQNINAKKIERGDPLVSSGFVGYVKIVKNERRDPFALISADRTWP